MREMHVMTVEHSLLAQLQACRDVLAETLYCNKQLHTVIRQRDIELGEMANELAHLRKKLAAHEPVMENVEVMCGG